MKGLIGGNWKTNGNYSMFKLFKEYSKELFEKIDCFIAVPYIYIPEARKVIPNFIDIAAQDISVYENGAHTGEISGEMLIENGVKFVIVGHSERRTEFKETNLIVNKKIKNSIKYGMIPVLCIGEPLECRKNNTYKEYLKNQFFSSLFGIKNTKIEIAYEPMWAVGTEITASRNEIAEVLEFIFLWVCQLNLESRIIYGGSVNEENLYEFKNIKYLNGFLVGKKSLTTSFYKILSKFSEHK